MAVTHQNVLDLRFFSKAQPPAHNWPAPSASGATLTRYASVSHNCYGTRRRLPLSDDVMATSSQQMAKQSAKTSRGPTAVNSTTTTRTTGALAVEGPIMELKLALKQRSSKAHTPYYSVAWHNALIWYNLLSKYSTLPSLLEQGFDAGIPAINITSTPPNNSSIEQHTDTFDSYVSNKFQKGWYLGPFSQEQIEPFLSLFQPSPLSIIPKPGQDNKYRLLQNLSFLYTPSSINHAIDSNLYPCIWSTFAMVCATIWHLPPGSEAAVRDVAEAHCTIPIQPSQWLGLVVRLQGCNLTLAIASAYVLLPDSLASLLTQAWISSVQLVSAPCANGQMTTSLFVSYASTETTTINFTSSTKQQLHAMVDNFKLGVGTGSRVSKHQLGSLKNLMMTTPSPYVTYPCCPLKAPMSMNLHTHSQTLTTSLAHLGCYGNPPRTYHSAQQPHSLALTGTWMCGQWLSHSRNVTSTWLLLTGGKKSRSIASWRSKDCTANSSMPPPLRFQDKCTSPNWRPCLVPSTSVLMLTTHTPAHTVDDLSWWKTTLPLHDAFLVLSRSLMWVPSQIPVPQQVSALSSRVDGVPGVSSWVGKQIAETLDGPKPLALSSLSTISLSNALNKPHSMYTVTTWEWSKGGGKGAAGIGQLTSHFEGFSNCLPQLNPQSSHGVFPAPQTPLMSLVLWYDSIPFHFHILVFLLWCWLTMMHGTDATLHASCASPRGHVRPRCSIFIKSLLLATPLFGNV